MSYFVGRNNYSGKLINSLGENLSGNNIHVIYFQGKNQNQQNEGKKVIHPLSRKAKALSKKITRDAKMTGKKSSSNMRIQLTGNKLVWFKEKFNSKMKCYTTEQVHALIERYINRNEKEVDQINLKHNIGQRKSRQHASRQDLLRICKETEMEEYNTSGFETVDLTDEVNVVNFKTWNGELSLLSNIKLKKFVKNSNDNQESASQDEEMVVDS